MPDIGAENCIHPGAERVGPPERGHGHSVVGLTAEIEWLGIELDPVFLAGDVAGGVIVENWDAAGEFVHLAAGPAVAPRQFGVDVVIAVLVDEVLEERAVELFRVHIGSQLPAAPLPMLDQIGEELAAPADSTFEEGEAQIREAPRHPAEKQRLGDGVPGGGEVADVVEGEVAGRIAQTEPAADGMESRRDTEFAAFLPNYVVVVSAVETELIVGHGKTSQRSIDT